MDYSVVFVLAHTVVTVKVDVLIGDGMRLKIMVEVAHCLIRTFPSVLALVDQIVDLLWEHLTTNSK